MDTTRKRTIGPVWEPVGKKEIVIDKDSNTEKQKAVKGFRDGSGKDNGESGCGVVVIRVDREKWVTISKGALPLRMCTAVAPEMTGVCLFICVLNLIPKGNLSVGNINRCVDGWIGTR